MRWCFKLFTLVTLILMKERRMPTIRGSILCIFNLFLVTNFCSHCSHWYWWKREGCYQPREILQLAHFSSHWSHWYWLLMNDANYTRWCAGCAVRTNQGRWQGVHLNALILQLQLVVGNKLLLTVVTLIPKHFNKHWEDEIASRSLMCKIPGHNWQFTFCS